MCECKILSRSDVYCIDSGLSVMNVVPCRGMPVLSAEGIGIKINAANAIAAAAAAYLGIDGTVNRAV